jgi:hypothetical protein
MEKKATKEAFKEEEKRVKNNKPALKQTIYAI